MRSAGNRLAVRCLRSRTRVSRLAASGRRASSMSWARRYSWSERPLSRARAASSSRASSGTSRMVIEVGMHALCCCRLHSASCGGPLLLTFGACSHRVVAVLGRSRWFVEDVGSRRRSFAARRIIRWHVSVCSRRGAVRRRALRDDAGEADAATARAGLRFSRSIEAARRASRRDGGQRWRDCDQSCSWTSTTSSEA